MEHLDKARQWIRQARTVAALTGAGISAESGIPTFRGAGGLWKKYRAEDLATPQAFARDPKVVWEWYDWRRQIIAKAVPNAAHRALLDNRVTVVTQNVDGLHDLAGSRNLIKLHGDIWTLRCTRCRREWTDRDAPLPELPPQCECGSMARPGVVWFGESLPEGVIERAIEVVRSADVVLVVGTSRVVYPAAGLVDYARGPVVDVNVEPGAFLQGKAGEILPALFT